MNLWQSFILGIVQGLTEYIPVSSSAHLVLIPWILKWNDPPFAFEVLVQWGTLLGVFFYFRQDLLAVIDAMLKDLLSGKPFCSPNARLGWYIGLATLPAVVFGLLLKNFFEAVFNAPFTISMLLIVTAILLFLAEFFSRLKKDMTAMRWPDALTIGSWQVLALLPGISRSGATIAGAMWRGFDRESSARFSFLLSIPALIGAGILALIDLIQAANLTRELPSLLIGFAAAAISGYLSIRWLLGYLKTRSPKIFAIYCLLFGSFNLLLFWLRKP